MRARFFASLVGGFLVAALALAFVPAPASAALQTCGPDEPAHDDPTGDVDPNPEPNPVPEEQSKFGRIDLGHICITESSDGVHLVVTVATAVDSDQTQHYEWKFSFSHNGTAKSITITHENGQLTAAPAGGGEATGQKVQFNLPRSGYSLGGTLSEMRVESTGRYVFSGATAAVTGTDEAGDNDADLPFEDYLVGQGSPPGTDSDADGLDDRDEVVRGTDPYDPDSDDDGLEDGAEIQEGSDPLNPDTDGDGLTDGEERSGTAMIDGQTVTFPATNATKPDSDLDGIDDLDEIRGTANTAYAEHANITGFPGSTNPMDPDTDDDGLADGDEVAGTATIGGEPVSFTPSDPNEADTDLDGIMDLDEVRGFIPTGVGAGISFSPTDPTEFDTDHDGVDDLKEIQSGTDPTDPDDKPTTGPISDVATYLPLSAAALLLVILISTGGILWRWG